MSLTQVGDRNQFRRAFAGATVHDMFNFLTVTVLFIVEMASGYLFYLSDVIVENIVPGQDTHIEILGKITKPLVNNIVQLDSNVLQCWSLPDCTEHDDSSLLKRHCYPEPEPNNTCMNNEEILRSIYSSEISAVNGV